MKPKKLLLFLILIFFLDIVFLAVFSARTRAAFAPGMIALRYDYDDGGDPCQSAHSVDYVANLSIWGYVGGWFQILNGEARGGYTNLANLEAGSYLIMQNGNQITHWCIPSRGESGSDSSVSFDLNAGEKLEVILALSNVPEYYREPKSGKAMGQIVGRNRYSGGGGHGEPNLGAIVVNDDYVFVTSAGSGGSNGYCERSGRQCITKIEKITGEPILEIPNYAMGINETNFNMWKPAHVETAQQIVISGNDLWTLGMSGHLNKFSASTGALVYQKNVSGGVTTNKMIYSSGYLWISANRNVLKIDPATGNKVATVSQPGGTNYYLYDMTASDNYIWVIVYVKNYIFRINKSTNAMEGPFKVWDYTGDEDAAAVAVDFDGQYVWVYGNTDEVSGSAHATLSQIDPSTSGRVGWYGERGEPFVLECAVGPLSFVGALRMSYVSGALWLYINPSNCSMYANKIFRFNIDSKTFNVFWYYPGGGDDESPPSSYFRTVVSGGSSPLTGGGPYYGLTIIDEAVANNPPETPTLVAPPTTWINYNPTYQADVTDPDSGDQVRAFFDFASGATDGYGTQGTTPYRSEYTPTTTADGQHSWWAKGVDDESAESGYTNWQMVRKDTVNPAVSVSGSNPTIDTARWDWGGTSDALSGLRASNTFYRDVGANLEARGYTDAWTTATFFNTGSLPDGTYQLWITAYDNAGNSATSNWVPVTIQTTGTISGYVWDDTNTPNPACTFDPAQDSKFNGTDPTDPGYQLDVSISELGISDEIDIDGNYSFSGLTAGNYTACIELPSAEWRKICPTNDGTLYEDVNVAAGGTTTVNFGLKYEIDGWYRGGVNGDVHTNGGIAISIPSGENFVTGGGVVTANGSISNVPGGTAESSWVIENYDRIDWPSRLLDDLTAADTDMTSTVHLKVYDTNLTITTTEPDWSTYFHSSSPTVIVAPNITIAGDVGGDPTETTKRINAILIAKDTLTVADSLGNEMLKIKGSVYAQTIVVNRDLDDNRYPAVEVEFDPVYFVSSVPYFTRAGYTWKEAK